MTQATSPETSLPPPGLSFSERDIRRWFDDRTLGRALGYADAVHQLVVLPELISAQVQGTAAEPYHVIILLAQPNPQSILIESECTCPVGFNCKHAAAALYAALRTRDEPPRPNPLVLAWIEQLAPPAKAAALPAMAPPPTGETLHYLFTPHQGPDYWHLSLYKGEIHDNRLGKDVSPWPGWERALRRPPAFVSNTDRTILRALAEQERALFEAETVILSPFLPGPLLEAIVASGRAWLREPPGKKRRGRGEITLHPLRFGPARPARVVWQPDPYGYLMAVLETAPGVLPLLSRDRVYYLAPAEGELGILDAARTDLMARLAQLPPLGTIDAALVAAALAGTAPELAPPAPPVTDTLASPPLGVLRIATREPSRRRHYHAATRHDAALDYAVPALRYDGIELAPGEQHPYYVTPDGRVVRLRRDLAREEELLAALHRVGLRPLAHRLITALHLPDTALGFADAAQWRSFVLDEVPRLRAAGWQVELPADFRHYVLRAEAWELAISEDDSGWLGLDMGIMVEGERLALAPLLHSLFAHDRRWLDGKRLAAIADDEEILFSAATGVRFTLPAARLKPLAATLIDLFDGRPETPLRLPRHDALRLAEAAAAARCHVEGGASALQLAERLRDAGQVKPLPQPPGLGLTLRPYQLEGLAWLQYLRTHDLGGILADDMGLGKTAQTLAHLLCEKQAGRLDRPALIVMPTSLVFNWQREAERFAPALRVLSLHGKERAAAFPLIPQHDLCITTYPLLWRDEVQLRQYDYHYVILDEAQSVKNALSRAAAVVRRLATRHRLCLTGTPLENHLGELWAQFDFLMPGFLGDSKQFTATWRNPIEKQGNAQRQAILARRVAPFILRRRKEDVARELPPKTIMVQPVELSGAQRDLYETVRSAMDEKVRDEIAARGFKRSQIVILDALLKLRQVCCDPRLLKSAAAARVKERAKLELLMEMVPELLSEGRRILLFSQFTTMLGLIEDELKARGIAYAKLTGATRKREEAVMSFQNGAVPLFLISLKAGGTGLNLTAADTVIHYDPWWNPAAENQATDRAHRIGQRKRVFVYKLVVAGSIEEKILALQEKKAELAAGILGEDHSALAKFSEADIRALLAPLPAEKTRTTRR